ncbi:DUF3331 domain-containing protein [Burkholderia lata]|uniref:DUF3331 domain-containing protein n=1 Tax=Burkholderia lata (strain ATCC 17760 / DSM 23089 / LMG 22485 / NCIMB 9086 / R18194 / 383) TaxID=482957 RepID=UPI003999EF8C
MVTLSIDPWLQTINLLAACQDRILTRTHVMVSSGDIRAQRILASLPLRASIRLIERQNSTTVTVAWSDPTVGYFGDQTWRLTRARHTGVCAISGRFIGCGDEIYRPMSRPIPVNAKAMILAEIVVEFDKHHWVW